MRKLKTSTLSILLHSFICWALNIHVKITTYQNIRFLMYLNKICPLELNNTNAHHTTGNRSWTCVLHVCLCAGGWQKRTPRMYPLCSEIPCCAVDLGIICAIRTFWLDCIQPLLIPMSNVKFSLIRSNERPIHEFQAWELYIQNLSIQQNFAMHGLLKDPSTSIQTLTLYPNLTCVMVVYKHQGLRLQISANHTALKINLQIYFDFVTAKTTGIKIKWCHVDINHDLISPNFWKNP